MQLTSQQKPASARLVRNDSQEWRTRSGIGVFSFCGDVCEHICIALRPSPPGDTHLQGSQSCSGSVSGSSFSQSFLPSKETGMLNWCRSGRTSIRSSSQDSGFWGSGGVLKQLNLVLCSASCFKHIPLNYSNQLHHKLHSKRNIQTIKAHISLCLANSATSDRHGSGVQLPLSLHLASGYFSFNITGPAIRHYSWTYSQVIRHHWKE